VSITVEVSAPLAAAMAERAQRAGETVEEEAARLLLEGAWAADEHLLRRHDADQAPVVRFANALLCQAIDTGAEEVHLVPDEDGVRVFHTNCHGSGARQVQAGPMEVIPAHVKAPLFARYESMAGGRLYWEGAPREERIPILHTGRHYDVFARYAPDDRSTTGESLVLRIARKPAPAV